MKNKSLIIIMLFIQTNLFSASPSYSRFNDFINADLLMSASNVTQEQSVLNAFVNPATQGAKDRITVDFNYSALFGRDEVAIVDSYYGTSFNVGVSVPTLYGVITANVGYIGSSSSSFLLRDQGFVNVAISKAVYENLFFGIGTKMLLGTSVSTNKAEWMLGIDLGMLHTPGKVGAVDDFKWGLSLQNLGWGSMQYLKTNYEQYIGSISLFQPELGISFSAFKKDNFKLGIENSLELPSFLNVRYSFGLNFNYADFFVFKISSSIDYRELAGVAPYKKTAYASLIPTFGFTFNVSALAEYDGEKLKKQKFNDFSVRTATGAFHNNINKPSLWGISAGATIPIGPSPKLIKNVSIETEEIDDILETEIDDNQLQPTKISEAKYNTKVIKSANKKTYNVKRIKLASPTKEPDIKSKIKNNSIKLFISPNGDSIKDGLKWNFKKKDSRIITEFKLEITDEKGNLVFLKEIKNHEAKSKGADFFKRLFLPRKPVTIPDTIAWDFKTADGEFLPDGLYFYQIKTFDEYFNKFETEKTAFMILKEYPFVYIKIKNDDNIFSPNDDKIKDTITIEQESSTEKKWDIVITDENNKPVYTNSTSGNLDKTFTWNGRDMKNVYLPDGYYFYKVFSTNAAGNKVEEELELLIDTTNYTCNLSANNYYFSPNNDKIQDSTVLKFTSKRVDYVDKWNLEIIDLNKNIIKSFQGDNKTFNEIIWNGTDEDGKIVLDGQYKANLITSFKNGNVVKNYVNLFVKTVAPTISISTKNNIFSPDNDKILDNIIFDLIPSEKASWTYKIYNQKNEVLLEQKISDTLPKEIIFNGKVDEVVLPSNDYSIKVFGQDNAGNICESNICKFILDVEKAKVNLSTNYNSFSPNSDGVKDYLTFKIENSKKSIVDTIKLTIYNLKNKEVANFDINTSSDEFIWNGKNNEETLTDGIYYAILNVNFKNGEKQSIKSTDFEIDTKKPFVEYNIINSIFSPNNDNIKDYLEIELKSSKEKVWNHFIKDSSNNIIKKFETTGYLPNLKWNGLDDKEKIASNGTYIYQINCQDESGNSLSLIIENLILDSSQIKVNLSTKKYYLTPNNDGIDDELNINIELSATSTIENWNLSIVDKNNQIIKSWSGEKSIPKIVTWDGKNKSSKLIEGIYDVKFNIKYSRGDEISTSLDNIVSDFNGPVIDLKVAPFPFAPDDMGINDKITIDAKLKDFSKIKNWKMEIRDFNNKPFKVFQEDSDFKNSLEWDGLSDKKELVISVEDYPYTFSAEDIYGNKSYVDGIIPVDILVFKDGDRYKIRISNITFEPNSKLLSKNSIEKNKNILDKIVKGLNKYPAYKIIIEGHANALEWANSARAKDEEIKALYPLSTSRAETIFNELVTRGILESRMTFKGVGGKNPIIDPKVVGRKAWAESGWQNRRVEFILEKN